MNQVRIICETKVNQDWIQSGPNWILGKPKLKSLHFNVSIQIHYTILLYIMWIKSESKEKLKECKRGNIF